MYKFSNKYNPFTTLSDHSPIIYSVGGIKILSWNILVKCIFNRKKKYYNNGFGILETQDEYLLRLKEIAKYINNLVNENEIDIVALQEMPKTSEDINYFLDLLEDNIANKAFRIEKSFFNRDQGNFCFFNRNKFEVYNFTNDFTEELGKLLIQPNLFQYFSIKQKNQSFALINLHLYWFTPKSEEYNKSIADIKTIINAAKKFDKTNMIILCGDFNLDLSETDLASEFEIYVEKNTTLAHKFDLDKQVFETVDGFIVIK